jgi:single-strand DNA-binding protein
MANLNKVMLIGRLTRDPEVRMFANGGKVAHFGFAVNNKRKNPQTGQWEDDPVFLEVDAFNRGDFGKKADVVEQYLRKGNQAFIEGHLKLDQWTSQDGQKRQKIKVVLDDLQLLERRSDGPSSSGPARGQAPPPDASVPMGDEGTSYDAPPPPDLPPPPAGRSDGDIPF